MEYKIVFATYEFKPRHDSNLASVLFALIVTQFLPLLLFVLQFL